MVSSVVSVLWEAFDKSMVIESLECFGASVCTHASRLPPYAATLSVCDKERRQQSGE